MAVVLPSLPAVAFTPLLPAGLAPLGSLAMLSAVLPANIPAPCLAALPVVLIATLFAVGRLPVALMLAEGLLPPPVVAAVLGAVASR